MDVWENGRQELAEEFRKVCDRIGANLAAELDHDRNAFVPREKLKLLREKAARVDELEDEVSSLTRQRRSLEAKLGGEGAAKSAEVSRLVEQNALLVKELESRQGASSRVDDLERENRRLSAELKQVVDNATRAEVPGGGSRMTATPVPTASEAPSSAPRPAANSVHNGSKAVTKDIYEGLVKKYNKLHENHQLLASARMILEKALAEKKERYQEHYHILEKRVQRRDATIGEQGEELQRLRAQLQNVTGEKRTTESPIFMEAKERIPSRASSVVPEARGSPDKLPMLLPGGYNGSDYRVTETGFVPLETYASTTGDQTPCTSTKIGVLPEIKEKSSTETPSSPETPIVVYSRSIRKTKSRKETNEPKKTPRVKIETISSSPLGLAAIQVLNESLDLDDIGERQSTPRKGRTLLQQNLRASPSLGNATQEETPRLIASNSSTDSQVSQETPIRLFGGKRTRAALQPRSPNTIVFPRTSPGRTQKRRRITSDQAISALLEDGQDLSSTEGTRKSNLLTPDPTNLLPDLLSKPSPPKHILVPVRPEAKPRNLGDSSAIYAQGHELSRNEPLNVINSGHLHGSPNNENLTTLQPTAKASVRSLKELPKLPAGESLGDFATPKRPPSKSTFKDSAYESRPLLRDSSETRLGTSKHFESSIKTQVQVQRPSRNSVDMCIDMQRPSSTHPFEKPKALDSAAKTTQLHLREQTNTPSTIPTQALRTRPFEQLTLQDFKVNPKYNQGYNYAFREVVRKQADRRCLPGCTKPDCCGRQFRVLVEALRDPSKPLTLSQEEADGKILEEFLGENAYKVRNMTKAERDETLIQAKTRDMANKNGKHRHAYERRQSPPGYWRSDFPSTQEQVQDFAKMQQLEGEQLAQRYEEAMRGGAYIFRDE